MPTESQADDHRHSRTASLSPAVFARMARSPSRYAPSRRAVDHAPFVPADLSILEACSARDVVMRDGAVESLSLSGRAFVNHGERLFREWPILGVRLVAIQPFMCELAHCPHLEHVGRLDLTGNQIGVAGLSELLSSPHARFDSIDLAANGLGDEGLRVLTSWPGFTSLRSLGLRGNHLTQAGLAKAVGLESLTLSDNPLRLTNLEPLTESLRCLAISNCEAAPRDLRRFSWLESLDLSHNPGHGQERTLYPHSLSHLDLSFCDIDSYRREWPPLRSLNLRGNHLRSCDFDLPASLEALDLALNPLGDDGVRRLVEKPRPANLRSLDLSNVGLTSVGLEVLHASGWLAGLEHLVLEWNPCARRVDS